MNDFSEGLHSHAAGGAQRRLQVLRAVIGLGFLAVCMRVAQLQIVQGREYWKRSEKNHIELVWRPAWRGFILDRNGKKIAANRSILLASFNPFSASREEARAMLARMSGILDIATDQQQELQPSAAAPAGSGILDASRLAVPLTRSQAFFLKERAPELAGIRVDAVMRRYYPPGAAVGHLVGYMGEISANEVEEFASEGYRPGQWVGKTGLERLYDLQLRGVDGGERIEVDARGRQQRVWAWREPQDGLTLKLSIDNDAQAAAQHALSGLRGACVALDPRNGEVLALVSTPGFDPNLLAEGKNRGYGVQLLTDYEKPLWNRAVQGKFPPASTFKVLTALAILENDISPDETINCAGEISIGNPPRVFRCWQRTGHGPMNLRTALGLSCDVYFYQMGLRLGAAILSRYAFEFGLGKKSGIDLPGDVEGLVPDRNWKQRRLRQNWYDGDTVNMSVGQGYLLASPVQMACLYAMICREEEGQIVRMRPRIVWQMQDSTDHPVKGYAPEVVAARPINPKHLAILRDALLGAVQWGTARAARIQGLEICGKTGTAQVPKGPAHAWFCAWAPAKNPRCVVSVFVESGGSGGKVAAPIARHVLAAALGVREVAVSAGPAESD